MRLKTLALLFLAAPVFAAAPRITNGSLQTVASLSQAPANGWIGYAFQTAKPLSISCCDDGISIHSSDSGDRVAYVFARFSAGEVERVRIGSGECALDAKGRPVGWVENVSPNDSIAFLRGIAERGAEHAAGGALLALSLHDGAVDALIDIARHNPSAKVRGKALFWLSQQAGEKAAAALRDAVENDPEEHVRAKAVFGISQLPNDESIPLLIDLLKHNRSREVRKKAAFWLGQKNDPRALAAIEEILRQ